ncbi:Chemotaxis protein methyltransferase CheR [Candidatus Magnetoovum chiemensis]|nr:Chemotaxis protein methyltransferase CheR [Candidatus Magnetoovum chiemensis]
MSINIHIINGQTQIIVLGSLENEDEEHEFNEIFNNKNTAEYEISFYDARVLPASVVMRLIALKQELNSKVKIILYNRYLSFYLSKVGIRHTLAPVTFSSSKRKDFKALALCGSADSLDKIMFIIENLPLSKITIFIVQHILENKENLLDKLLKTITDYSVVMPHNMMPVAASTIYIAPPGYHIKVNNGLLYLTRGGKVNYARPSIDVLFNSLAYEYGEELIAAVLCGYGKDGVDELKTLRQKGSTIIIEKSSECTAQTLTENAKKSGSFDYILSVKEMLSFFTTVISPERTIPDDIQIKAFLEAVYDKYGYDFRGYHFGTIGRRVEKLMGELKCDDFFLFQKEVLMTPEIFERFFLEISINVTNFFRHPEQFIYLKQKILPYLNSFPNIRVWSAGCASGEEAYSIAIILHELGLLHKSQIYATDINPYVLIEAKNGLFSKDILEKSIENYKQSGLYSNFLDYFDIYDTFIRIKPQFQKRILFFKHSLAHDWVINEFHLIMCRNVFIYFQQELQNRAMLLFASSLHAEGFLLIGENESIAPIYTKEDTPLTCDNEQLKVYRLKY